MANNGQCECDWHKTINYMYSTHLLSYTNQFYIDYTYINHIIMYIITKYGIEHLQKLEQKCKDYFMAILEDAPFPYEIFNNDISSGCYFNYFIKHKELNYLSTLTTDFTHNIYQKYLSVPTVKHILQHHSSNLINLDIFKLFTICMQNRHIDYFSNFAISFEELFKKNDISIYADYIIQANSDNQTFTYICKFFCKYYGASEVLSAFKNAKCHGKFPKTPIVNKNYETICEIIANI